MLLYPSNVGPEVKMSCSRMVVNKMTVCDHSNVRMFDGDL